MISLEEPCYKLFQMFNLSVTPEEEDDPECEAMPVTLYRQKYPYNTWPRYVREAYMHMHEKTDFYLMLQAIQMDWISGYKCVEIKYYD